MEAHNLCAEVIPLRRSWRSLFPALLPAIAVGVAGLLVDPDSGLFSTTIELPWGGSTLPVSLPVFALLFLVLLARPLMLRFDGYAEIRPHHVNATRGICSLRRLSTSVPYEDIRGVKVVQNLWDRLVGSGTLYCWSVAAESPEIRIFGVAHVRKHAELIKQHIDIARTERAVQPASRDAASGRAQAPVSGAAAADKARRSSRVP